MRLSIVKGKGRWYTSGSDFGLRLWSESDISISQNRPQFSAMRLCRIEGKTKILIICTQMAIREGA